MSETKKDPISVPMVLIDGKPYRVEDKPSDEVIRKRGPKAFKKGTVYRFNTQLSKFMLPYQGIIDDVDEFNSWFREPGIYFIRKPKGKYAMRLIRPKTIMEQEKYRLGQERNMVVGVLDHSIRPEDIMEVRITSADVGGDTFSPPLYQEDDALNLLIKTGIRLKAAPYEPYGRRMAALAVDKFKGVEGSNIRNNMRRALKLNHNMSATKALQCADTWQMEIAYIIKDQPGAMHPMFPDDPDAALIVYPGGIPFEIHPDKLIDAAGLIQVGIADTNQLNRNEEED